MEQNELEVKLIKLKELIYDLGNALLDFNEFTHNKLFLFLLIEYLQFCYFIINPNNDKYSCT
jgi:hypothetical protein